MYTARLLGLSDRGDEIHLAVDERRPARGEAEKKRQRKRRPCLPSLRRELALARSNGAPVLERRVDPLGVLVRLLVHHFLGGGDGAGAGEARAVELSQQGRESSGGWRELGPAPASARARAAWRCRRRSSPLSAAGEQPRGRRGGEMRGARVLRGDQRRQRRRFFAEGGAVRARWPRSSGS